MLFNSSSIPNRPALRVTLGFEAFSVGVPLGYR
jgi:hypothetical protein